MCSTSRCRRAPAGDVFYEPADDRISRFDALDDGVTFLAYFPLAAGQDAAIEMLD